MKRFAALVVLALATSNLASLESQTNEARSADFDGNGSVDFSDFIAFAGAFGGNEPQFDLNANGVVDFGDFLNFAQAFGQANPPPEDSEPPPLSQTLRVTTPGRSRHTLRLVPQGVFAMGIDEDPSTDQRHKPLHEVFLDDFYIDEKEVTYAQFVTFLNAIGANLDPESDQLTELIDLGSDVVGIVFSNAFELKSLSFVNRPATHVNWFGANAYCRWMEGRLPTEAEWEKAGRGTDGQTYPWGNEDPTSELANWGNNVGETTNVGSYPNGISPYGIHDMAGNALEWVADWYGVGYYVRSPSENPQGPSGGDARVVRGGGFGSPALLISVIARFAVTPGSFRSERGFRCVRDP